MHGSGSIDEVTQQNKRSYMHEDAYKVVGGSNPRLMFHNSGLTLKKQYAIESTKRHRIVEF